VALLHPGRASAQDVSSAPASNARGANVGWAYAWSGGVVTGPDGALRKRNHPRVTQVAAGSVGARAGLRVQDVIVSINGRDSRHMPMFVGVRPGDTITLRVRRGEEEREISYVWPR
jgi:S1-C subfamily serine protease